MKIGKRSIEIFLDNVETLLSKATAQSNPGLWLSENDLRTPMFMLEGLARVYKKIYGSKVFDELNDDFKAVEDALGLIDYYSVSLEQLTANKTIPATIIAYLNKQTAAAVDEFNKLLENENWLNGKRIDIIKETINDTDWKDEEEELKGIRKFYWKAIEKAEEFVNNTHFKFDNVEDDVHELRRKLRWLSIYPQALQGVFRYKAEQAIPTAHLKKYLTDEIINSPYNVMPENISVKEPLLLSKNYFLALSWTIAELGNQKDEGLRVEVVKEALEHTGSLKDEEAYGEAYKILGAEQLKIEQLLAKAEAVAKKFFEEGNLKNILPV